MVSLKSSDNYTYYAGIAAVIVNILAFEIGIPAVGFYSLVFLTIVTIWYKDKISTALRESFQREKTLVKMLEERDNVSRK